MVNRYTYKEPCSKEILQKLYSKNMTQTEIAKKLGVSQKVIWNTMKKYCLKARIAKKRNQFGKNNDNWKGNKIKYAATHRRVEELRGKPKICEVCGTTKAKRYEWANLTRDYNNLLDYKRMCKQCHHKHDHHPINKQGLFVKVGGDAKCV